MKRMALVVVGVMACSVTVSACGGPSAYCSAVDDATKTLDTFGQNRTTKAFTGYAATLKAIAAEAPEGVRSDWTTLAEATQGVITAHQAVGLTLEDVADAKKSAELDAAQRSQLNDAYQKFNDTTKQREAVVKNVKAECDITLS